MAVSPFARQPKRHPFLAFLHVLGIFAASSLCFNVLVGALAGGGLEGLFTGFVFATIPIALGCFALFVGPAARAAESSRRFGKLVLLGAAVTAFLIYVAALRLEWRWVTEWLFPHWPGSEMAYSSGDIQLAAICGFIIYAIGWLYMSGLDSEPVPLDEEGMKLGMARDGLGVIGDQGQAQEGADADLELDLG
jgi:hypothetical protein